MSQIPSMMSGVSTALSQAYAKPSATNCMSFRAINKPKRTHYFIIEAFCSNGPNGNLSTLFRRWSAAIMPSGAPNTLVWTHKGNVFVLRSLLCGPTYCDCLCPSTAGSLNWWQGHLCPLLRSKRAAATIPPLTNSRLSRGKHHLRATSPTLC